jgi:hypothetical protein
LRSGVGVPDDLESRQLQAGLQLWCLAERQFSMSTA